MTREIPSVQTFAPLIDTVRRIARDELPAPRTMQLWLWDDSDYRVYVFHAMGDRERKQIVYDPDWGEVRWQHCKFAPEEEQPHPSDVPEGEERVIEPEFVFNEERVITSLASPLE